MRLLASQPHARVPAARRSPSSRRPTEPAAAPALARAARCACRAVLPRHPPPPAAAQFISRRLPPASATHVSRQALAGGADDDEEEEEGDGYISGCGRRRWTDARRRRPTAAVKAERTAEVAAEENWSRKRLQGADDDDDDDESQHSDTRPRVSSRKNLLRRPSADGAKFTVGARVSHYSHRVGTVTEVLPSPEGSVTVRFDNGETHHYKTRSQWKLRELSYGDDFTSEGVQSVNSPGRNSPTKFVTRFVSEMGDRTIDATKKVGNRTREAAKSVEKLGKDATGALLDATQGVTDATVGVAKMALSPLEYFLFPYQQWIGKYLVYLRQTRASSSGGPRADLAPLPPAPGGLDRPRAAAVAADDARRRRRPPRPAHVGRRRGGGGRRRPTRGGRRSASGGTAARWRSRTRWRRAPSSTRRSRRRWRRRRRRPPPPPPRRRRRRRSDRRGCARMAAQTRPQYDALHVPTSTVPIERYGTRYRGIASREAAWLN